MDIDYLVKLAKLGLAGAVVLFAFLAFRLLSESTAASGIDPDCLSKAITANHNERDTAIATTDKVLNDISGSVQDADGNNRNLQNAWTHAHQAQIKMPSFREALTKERSVMASLGPNLKACGYVPRDWTPFYAFLVLQLLLALLLFALEIIRMRRSINHNEA